MLQGLEFGLLSLVSLMLAKVAAGRTGYVLEEGGTVGAEGHDGVGGCWGSLADMFTWNSFRLQVWLCLSPATSPLWVPRCPDSLFSSGESLNRTWAREWMCSEPLLKPHP